MAYDPQDTIVAIASPTGGGARGILRVSGHDAISVVAKVCNPENAPSWQNLTAAEAVASEIQLKALDRGVPCRLFIWPNAQSYTREPIVEIHMAGSEPLLKLALGELVIAGGRLAEPGEFTLRAFLAGRVDLPQAEAVLGVIDATDEHSLRAALDQLAGGLSSPLGRLREVLLNLLAHLEAGLDFVEDDIEFISTGELNSQLAEAIEIVESTLHGMLGDSLALERPRVVMRGRPNVGKSSLFNALVGHEHAIVADMPGTTRDYLEATLELGNTLCHLIDTAGLDDVDQSDKPGTIENTAQNHATQQSEQASISLICIDVSRALVPEEQQLLRQTKDEARLVVFTKCDRPIHADYEGPTIHTSSVTGKGLDNLVDQLSSLLAEKSDGDLRCVAATAVRCGNSLEEALASLRTARELAEARGDEELVAAEVRVALNHIGQVIGTVYTDDILDRIFSRFCIGK